MAASDALSRVEAAPQRTLWKPILILSALVYLSSIGLAWVLAEGPLWARVLLMPLFPASCAAAAFWRRQTWKFRAKDWKFKLKIWEDALEAVGHEAANAVNAIRAQLIGFRLANR